MMDPLVCILYCVTGEVYALSCDTRLDVDDSAAITPDGHLHLLLGKLTYQQVHLSGRLSHHILRKPKERFGECYFFWFDDRGIDNFLWNGFH